MNLYAPNPIFSEADKRVLALLAKLLLNTDEPETKNSNVPRGTVVLSDLEAKELADDLRALVSSRPFVSASFFAEAVTDPSMDGQARELYLSERKRRGRSRALATNQWVDFQTRLGFNVPGYRIVPTTTMSLDYFKKMERRLLRSSGLSPHVVEIIMSVIDQQEEALVAIREQRYKLRKGIIKAAVIDPVMEWSKDPQSVSSREMSRERVVGIMTVVADVSVMFTTRDWGVTGTLSTIAGGLAAAMMR